MKKHKALLSALLLAGASAAQASLIDTVGAWDGEHGTFPFGRPNTATIGQTFNTGTDNYLSQLAFYLSDDLVGQSVEFQVYLAEWDGEKAVAGTGEFLGQYNSDGSGSYARFDLSSLSVYLNQFSDYIFFLTTSYSNVGQPESEAWVGSLEEDSYLAGDLVYLNNGDQFDEVYSQSWNYWYDADLAFELTLTEVPEPTGMALMGLGLLALAARRNRRV